MFDALYRPILAIVFDPNWVWPAPESLVDLAHITAITHLMAFWSKNKGPERIEVERPAKAHPTAYLIEKYYKGRKQVNGSIRSALEGPVDYRGLVDPSSVRALAVNIASVRLENELAVFLRAGALFEYVKKMLPTCQIRAI